MEELARNIEDLSLSSFSHANAQIMLEKLQEEIKQLYKFRDQYFMYNPEADATKKWEEVRSKMRKIVQVLDNLRGKVPEHLIPKLEYVLGKALNVMEEHSLQAQEYLAKAVKLDPTCVEAWNELGESYWKAGDSQGAKTCFLGAAAKQKNKVSLRNLSVVSRQEPANDSKHADEGLRLAKDAVQLDPTDGTSWTILGNAYFYHALNMRDGNSVKAALVAYAQAEKDAESVYNVELYYNKANVLKYEEKFSECLECFKKARSIDPSWQTCKTQYEFLISYLERLDLMVRTKGQIKPRRLQNMLEMLSSKDAGISSAKMVQVEELNIGVNSALLVLGKVIYSVLAEDHFAFCLADKNGNCIAVTVYNLADGQGFAIGDSIAILEPNVKHVELRIDNKDINFQLIRLEDPRKLCLNGRPLHTQKMAPMRLKTSLTFH